ncbi:MAG: hypothetical protein PHQ28_06645 [Mycobacterium sp.]|nr:hypothetical protein [Mycobacterium sp.]
MSLHTPQATPPLLLVHAKNDVAKRFYLRYGFEESPVNDMTLMLLVKDVRPGITC